MPDIQPILPDLGAEHRQRLIRSIQLQPEPTRSDVRRAIGGLLLVGLTATLVAAAVQLGSELADELRAGRRASERAAARCGR